MLTSTSFWLFACLAAVNVSATVSHRLFKRSPFFSRKGYLSSTFDTGMKGGLGNNLFELLSIVGIADTLDRYPYVKLNRTDMIQKLAHIHELFPRLQQQFTIVYWNMSETTINFNKQGCCIYEDPKRLKKVQNEYMVIQGDFFQSYKYFDFMRSTVREWLQPNKAAEREAEIAFPQDFQESFVICAHTRRGDYVHSSIHEASNANFSTNALMYLMLKYQAVNDNVGVLVFGDDPTWNMQTFTGFPRIAVMRNSPEADLAMSGRHCDVVLLTAPSSTFGFFMGYLSKQFEVYYRDIMTTTDVKQNHMIQEDYFPGSWKKISEVEGIIAEVRL